MMKNQMFGKNSQYMRFPTMSDQSLGLSLKYAMIVKLVTEHHLEFLSLKRRLQRLGRVYICQNATLLEIGCTV